MIYDDAHPIRISQKKIARMYWKITEKMANLHDLKERERYIHSILQRQPVDLNALREVSKLPGGFINNHIRRKVWPKLLRINRYFISDYRSFIDPHRDDSQVRADVERSLWNIQHADGWEELYRERRRKSLTDVMMAILCRNPHLYYYQGYHDLISVFLLVLEDDHLTFAVAEVVSRNYVADYMNKNFEYVGKSMEFLMVIVKAADPELHAYLGQANIAPFFATSWLITWFAHDLKSMKEVAQLYDVLLCAHPVFCYFICASVRFLTSATNTHKEFL